MSVNIVPEATWGPGRCAASGTTSGPFVDTGLTLGRHRVYLSVHYLNSIAPEMGWVPAPELAQALTDLEEAYATVERLSLRVEGFEEDVQAVTDAMATFAAEILTAGDE
jgi:hypothetical protein